MTTNYLLAKLKTKLVNAFSNPLAWVFESGLFLTHGGLECSQRRDVWEATNVAPRMLRTSSRNRHPQIQNFPSVCQHSHKTKSKVWKIASYRQEQRYRHIPANVRHQTWVISRLWTSYHPSSSRIRVSNSGWATQMWEHQTHCSCYLVGPSETKHFVLNYWQRRW